MKKLIVCSLLFLLTPTLIGCWNEKQVEVTDERVNVTSEEKASYEEIAEKSVEDLGDVTDDVKRDVKTKSIYDAILDREGRDLMKTISITREEAIVELNKNIRPKLFKVIEMDIPCEDSEHSHEGELDHNTYYVYEGDTSFEGVDLYNMFKGAKNIVYREATFEDNIEEIKRSLASEELVKLIDSKVEKVLS